MIAVLAVPLLLIRSCRLSCTESATVSGVMESRFVLMLGTAVAMLAFVQSPGFILLLVLLLGFVSVEQHGDTVQSSELSAVTSISIGWLLEIEFVLFASVLAVSLGVYLTSCLIC